ncbi:hypothetical protein BU23DRAFT_561604 [Bimuria novae-zelandiae CBS 107.79]|uniref:Uncharacterized protein n=1 Tax=Bimuria novae-zelandiae CBS 107.79 TaxID=1447943 RepID=A0A6A5UKC8_9PLEO|nr:hypothetical protein BU23DRAFT_561604 [Bimuria novae-zelandiae CBS 107.79]
MSDHEYDHRGRRYHRSPSREMVLFRSPQDTATLPDHHWPRTSSYRTFSVVSEDLYRPSRRPGRLPVLVLRRIERKSAPESLGNAGRLELPIARWERPRSAGSAPSREQHPVFGSLGYPRPRSSGHQNADWNSRERTCRPPESITLSFCHRL